MATLDDLLAHSDRRLVGPLGFWHAAALEQVPAATMVSDPDAAARALGAAARLYGLDLVFAAPLDAVAWAVRGAAAPDAPVAAIVAQHRSGHPVNAPADAETVADTAATRFVEAVLTRLRSLSSTGVLTAIAVPTAETLSASLGPAVTKEWADDAVGAVLRRVGATEPDLIMRLGEGPRTDLVPGLSDFFDLALVEATGEEPGLVSAPTGDEFVEGVPAIARLVTTRTELPALADPKQVAHVVRTLRAKVEQ